MRVLLFIAALLLTSCIKDDVGPIPPPPPPDYSQMDMDTVMLKEYMKYFRDEVDSIDGCISDEGLFFNDTRSFQCQTANYKTYNGFIGDFPYGYNSHPDSFAVLANGFSPNIWDPDTIIYEDVVWYQYEDSQQTQLDTAYIWTWEFNGGSKDIPCSGSYGIYPKDKPGVPNGSLAVTASLDRLHLGRSSFIVGVYDPNISTTKYYLEYWKKW